MLNLYKLAAPDWCELDLIHVSRVCITVSDNWIPSVKPCFRRQQDVQTSQADVLVMHSQSCKNNDGPSAEFRFLAETSVPPVP